MEILDKLFIHESSTDTQVFKCYQRNETFVELEMAFAPNAFQRKEDYIETVEMF